MLQITDNLKFKLMDLACLYRLLDKLIRLKPTEEKFLRVYDYIIQNFLINPKYNQKQLNNLDFEYKKRIAAKIWNNSIKSFYTNEYTQKLYINKLLQAEEERLFNVKNEKYFESLSDIENLLALPCPLNPVPCSVQWLKKITPACNIKKLRQEYGTKFPIEKIIITEGITEEILLPVFAKLLDYDFNKYGIYLISAGGKNQVARWYSQYSACFKIPIFILLDNDAKEVKNITDKILKPQDKIHIIKNGEFEDIIPLKLIKKTVNNIFKNEFSITINELRTDIPTCKKLKQIYKDHKVGDFKKADFAVQVAQSLKTMQCYSEEIKQIIEELKKL